MAEVDVVKALKTVAEKIKVACQKREEVRDFFTLL